MTEKKIIGEFRLFKCQGINKIEKSTDMDDGTEIVFISMLVEYLAYKHEITPERTTEILLDGIEKYPASFDDMQKKEELQ